MTNYNEQADFWRNRNCLLEAYFKPKLVNRSVWMAEQVKDLGISSLWEMGCYTGRNLKHMGDILGCKIGGVDVNPDALSVAREHLPGAELVENDILNCDTDEKWDLVFTHGVLMHIVPEALPKVIDKCVEKSSRYIMHLERKEQNGKVIRGPAEKRPEVVSTEWRWAPNFSEIYAKRNDVKIIDKRVVKIEGSGKPSTYILLEKI